MDKKQYTDEKIVEITRSGNKETFGELIEKYQDKITRYVNYLTNSSNWTEDIVQNVFIKAFENLNGFDTKKKFSSWIYRIAHNEAVNKLRKENRVVLGLDFSIFEEFKSKEIEPEEEYEKEETKKILATCLNEMPLKYKEVLVLFYIENKKYEEIGDILRLPIGTVGTRVNRGKKLLRKICQKKI